MTSKPPKPPYIPDDSDRTIVFNPGESSAPPAPPPIGDDAFDDATIVTGGVGPARGGDGNEPTHVDPNQEAPTPKDILQPGTIINKMYRVGEPLGQGGMGRVYRGVDISLDESVAIKVIQPEMADTGDIVSMFAKEAATLRQLHHDAIVRFFAYVQPSEELNLHCLVMGFIEGTKLSDRVMEQGPLTPEETCRCFIRLADGLQKAHDAGVIHRDLSPDNVMLKDDDLDQAVLIDFGIARSSARSDVTLAGSFAGKLKYVSPEQFGAFGGNVEAQSDVYSLGLLMIMATTGKSPPMGDSMHEAIRARDNVPDLSPVPVEFHGLLTQMLQPDPAQRTPNTAAVKTGLEAIARGNQFDMPTMPTAPAMFADMTTPGLQASPAAAMRGAAITTAPYQSTTGFGVTTPPGGSDSYEEEPQKRSRAPLMIFLLVLAALGGGAGYFWPQIEPMLTGQSTASTDATEDAGPQRVEGTRSAFLAQAVPQDGCAYASRRGFGANAGIIEAFGGPQTSFSGLAAAWAAEFNSQPSVVERKVDQAQCAALSLAQGFQGTAVPAIEVTLENASLPRSEGIVGAIIGGEGRATWLAIVAPNGRVFSLTRQLNTPIGTEQRFGFGLRQAQPGTYVVLGIASEKALARTGAMQDGTMSSDVLPLIGRELEGDARGTVDIGLIELLP